MALHQEDVTVHPVQSLLTSDENGTPQYNALPDIELHNCQVGPLVPRAAAISGDVEPTTGRWRVSTDKDDPHPEIPPNATVTWRGDTYEVLGLPETFWAIRPHTEFVIIQSKG